MERKERAGREREIRNIVRGGEEEGDRKVDERKGDRKVDDRKGEGDRKADERKGRETGRRTGGRGRETGRGTGGRGSIKIKITAGSLTGHFYWRISPRRFSCCPDNGALLLH